MLKNNILKNKNFYFSLIIIFIMLILAIFPSRYHKIALDGISMWALIVLPSIFPYLVLSTLLTKLNFISGISSKTTPFTKKLFRTSGTALYVFIISIFSGYPVGSKVVSELYENKLLKTDESARVAFLSSTSSPAFILGAVGGAMLNNSFYGIIIFISHLLSAFITGIIMRFYGKKEISLNSEIKTIKSENMINEAVYNGVISILIVGGLITVCYLIIHILIDFKILSPLIYIFNFIFKDSVLAEGLVSGIIESTTGIKILSQSTNILKLPIITFLISFGGISIITQSLYFLKKTKIKTAVFILSKLIQAVIGFIICFILCCFL